MLLNGQAFADDASALLDVTPPGWSSRGYRTAERTRAAIAAAEQAAPLHEVVSTPVELLLRVSLLEEPDATLREMREKTRDRVRAAVAAAFAHPETPTP